MLILHSEWFPPLVACVLALGSFLALASGICMAGHGSLLTGALVAALGAGAYIEGIAMAVCAAFC